MSDAPQFTVTHDAQQGRFMVTVEGLLCKLDYQLTDCVMHITHTGVPQALEGRGIAAQLVKAALTWARQEQLKVNPVCSYVSVYMRRHAEWADLRQP